MNVLERLYRRGGLPCFLASVVLSSLLLLTGCGAPQSEHPWDPGFWDFALKEMNARPSDAEQTDPEILAAAQDYFASLESSATGESMLVELLDTSEPQDLRVKSAAEGDVGAVAGGSASEVYLVVSYGPADAREEKLVRVNAFRSMGEGPILLSSPEREDKVWARKLMGATRETVTSTLGEASGAHRDDDMVFEYLRGENLRPQWLVFEFESDRVSRVHIELNQE